MTREWQLLRFFFQDRTQLPGFGYGGGIQVKKKIAN